jgi:ADP-ribose pyrophosphatase
MIMDSKPVIIERTTKFSTPWFEVIAKTVEDKQTIDPDPYYAIRLQDYVTIFALTTSKEILLVQQYRPVVEDYTLELPSGHVEDGEAPADAAIRELLEETGYLARNLELLGTLIPDTGRLENRLWCYFASDLILDRQGLELKDEGLKVRLCKTQEFIDMIVQQEITHALDLAVVALVMIKNKLRLN